MPGLAEAFDRIGEALERHLPLTHAAGIALAVTDPDETLGVAVRGFADAASGSPVHPETRFEIGSISKSFAAMVALQEADAGRLDLHVSVNELLPWLDMPEPFGPITLHHLMTHTSGLAMGTEEAPTGLGAATFLRRLAPTFPPGAHFSYSNDGFKLVGLVLERATGRPIHELLRERVFEPLEMSASVAAITDDARADLATGYQPMFADRMPQLTHPLVPANWLVSNSADGSIVSNVIDMSAYARVLCNRGAAASGRLLPEPAFDLWSTQHIAIEDDRIGGYGYGLDVGQVDGHRWLGHTGGMVGYTAHLAVLPDEGLGCVVLQNGEGDKWQLMRHVFEVVGAVLRGRPVPPAWTPRDPERVADAEAYAGRYEGTERSLEVELDGDRLRIILGGIRAVLQQDPLADPGDLFLVPHPALERHPISFGRDPSGRVVEAFHGNEWFRGGSWIGPEPDPAPQTWACFPGVYRSNNPWAPAVRVVLRKGRLAIQWPWEGGEEELVPLEDDWFAIGDAWTPRRVRFDAIVDGKAAIVDCNGGRFYRSFED